MVDYCDVNVVSNPLGPHTQQPILLILLIVFSQPPVNIFLLQIWLTCSVRCLFQQPLRCSCLYLKVPGYLSGTSAALSLHIFFADKISTASTFFQEHRYDIILMISSKETHLIHSFRIYRSNIFQYFWGSDGNTLFTIFTSKLKSASTPVNPLH